MNILETINALVVSLGIPTVIIAAICIGKKMQILDDLDPIRKKFSVIESKVNDLWVDLKDVRSKVDDMFFKVDLLWKDKSAPTHSPRQLNERGLSILEKSGIKEVIDSKKDTLLKIVKEKGATNPYDAEAIILSVVSDLSIHCPDVVEGLKTGAFNSGASISEVLLVGGYYLRNLIFPDLGFNVDGLDKPKQTAIQ